VRQRSYVRTGNGGEELIGMTWALFIAGTPATVATSWKIDSASAARFTVEFHRNLKEGQN
jgi:CHAT domain-containing protein